MKPNTVILVGILFMLSLSCQKNDKQLITQPLEQNEGLRQIPVEEALATLNEFLQANKGDLLETKSGRPREIVSVFPYYGSHKGAQTETRATNGSVDNIPNAYLVNFGWEGLSNGYFSTSCLNPSKAEEYDDPSNKSSSSYAYSWHFRLITYDVPSDHCTGTIDYMY